MRWLAGVCAIGLFAAWPGLTQAQDLQDFYVETAPEASPEAVDEVRRILGAAQVRVVPGSRFELWRVPAERLREAVRAAQQAPALRAADIAGRDYRSLFVEVGTELPLSAEQTRERAAIDADSGLRETSLVRLRAGALGALPLFTGFGQDDGLPAASSFMLELRPGLLVVAARGSRRGVGDATLWSGTLFDPVTRAPVGQASLAIRGDALSGFVSAADGNFSIRSLGGGIHAISRIAPPVAGEIDETRKSHPSASLVERLEQALSLTRGMRNTMYMSEAAHGVAISEAASSGPAVIRIGVAYTAAAAKMMRGRGALSPQAEVEIAIEAANGSFSASGINVVLKLAGTQPTMGRETAEIEEEVSALIDRKDDRYDEIPGWRRRINANAIILIVAGTNRCGLGPAIPATAAQAFAVVREDCIRKLVIPHEIGHLLGARHDDDPEDWPFPYGRGYVASRSFQTIMGNSTTEVRAAIWAGPNIRWNGAVTGNADRNNDARAINEQARVFATFRGD